MHITSVCIQHAMIMRHTVIRGLPGSPYFSTLSHKRHDFPKALLNIKCVFLFSLQRLSETFLIIRRTGREITKKRNLLFTKSTRSFPILMKLEFHRHVFQKYSNIKFNENPSTGNRVVPCAHTDGRTGTHDEANSRFS